MGVLSTSYLLAIGMLQLFFQFASAEEYCGNLFYCYDQGHRSAYCCGTRQGRPLCCFRTKIWSLWYFWFGIVIFFLVLSSCIAGCKRRQARLRMQQPVQRTSVITTTTTTQQTVPTMYPNHQQVNPLRNTDAPPSYEQIQDPSIASQYAKQPLPSSGKPFPSHNYSTIYSTQPGTNDPPVPPYPGH